MMGAVWGEHKSIEEKKMTICTDVMRKNVIGGHTLMEMFDSVVTRSIAEQGLILCLLQDLAPLVAWMVKLRQHPSQHNVLL